MFLCDDIMTKNIMSLALDIYDRRVCASCATGIKNMYNHAAVIFSNDCTFSYGENRYHCQHKTRKNQSGSSFSSTIHAEENAIRKLPPLPRHKKLKKVDILVIRANKASLGNSKPCMHCLHKMKNLPRQGYIVDKIFYSTMDGTISVARLDDLLYNETPHVSSYYRGYYSFEKQEE